MYDVAKKWRSTVEALMMEKPGLNFQLDTCCPGFIKGEIEPCSRTDKRAGYTFKSCGLKECLLNQLLRDKEGTEVLQECLANRCS